MEFSIRYSSGMAEPCMGAEIHTTLLEKRNFKCVHPPGPSEKAPASSQAEDPRLTTLRP